MNRLLPIGLLMIGVAFTACSRRAEPVRIGDIGEKEYDSEKWGKVYPLHYERHLQTAEPAPAGKSDYKKGWDEDGRIYDKLSQYPFLALLYNGFGFGIEYNEPRGHEFMLKDIREIDSSRRSPGGVCLSCKTSHAQELVDRYGISYFSDPFDQVLERMPEEFRDSGVGCLSCHEPQSMALRILNQFSLGKALNAMDTDMKGLGHQDMRTLVCAQCHVTYVVQKNEEMKSVNLFFPWQRSRYGRIGIEEIIAVLKSDPAYLEWKQGVTGFKLGYIRHPEFELYSNQSTHWSAGLGCADCHMPFTRVGNYKISDHRIMSPLKNDFKACIQCHSQEQDWLRERVRFIQDRAMSLYIRAGYANAVCAKLFEKANLEKAAGRTVDENLYALAREQYEQAFYRLVFFGAENSIGFHNPPEAMRILGDSARHAAKAEALLRQLLTRAGLDLPAEIDLELDKYLNQRGERGLDFIPEMEFKDPLAKGEG